MNLGSSFTRSCRLTRKADFQSVFDQSQKVSRKGIICLYRPNGSDHPRLGIIVSKQQVKRAVDRNRLRRIVRESFRQVIKDLQSLDMIVLLRIETIAFTKAKLRLEMDAVWLSLTLTHEQK